MPRQRSLRIAVISSALALGVHCAESEPVDIDAIARGRGATQCDRRDGPDEPDGSRGRWRRLEPRPAPRTSRDSPARLEREECHRRSRRARRDPAAAMEDRSGGSGGAGATGTDGGAATGTGGGGGAIGSRGARRRPPDRVGAAARPGSAARPGAAARAPVPVGAAARAALERREPTAAPTRTARPRRRSPISTRASWSRTAGAAVATTPERREGSASASQSSAYTAVKARVTPGNGTGSRFYMTVNSGSMPRGQAKLSAANLAKIKAWIDAGALNN